LIRSEILHEKEHEFEQHFWHHCIVDSVIKIRRVLFLMFSIMESTLFGSNNVSYNGFYVLQWPKNIIPIIFFTFALFKNNDYFLLQRHLKADLVLWNELWRKTSKILSKNQSFCPTYFRNFHFFTSFFSMPIPSWSNI
jgi:hypothetical protein